MTFHGQSTHQLDDKGRLCLPKRIHALVPKDADGERTIWLTRGQGGCVWLFTAPEFERRLEALPDATFDNDLSQAVEREFWASTFKTKLDGSHRVLVPEELRELADLRPSAEAVVIGLRGKVELWNPERRQAARLADADYDRLAPTWAATGGGPSLQQSVQAMQTQAFHQLQQQQAMENLRRLGFFAPFPQAGPPPGAPGAFGAPGAPAGPPAPGEPPRGEEGGR